jgi:hypothetical protein
VPQISGANETGARDVMPTNGGWLTVANSPAELLRLLESGDVHVAMIPRPRRISCRPLELGRNCSMTLRYPSTPSGISRAAAQR